MIFGHYMVVANKSQQELIHDEIWEELYIEKFHDTNTAILSETYNNISE